MKASQSLNGRKINMMNSSVSCTSDPEELDSGECICMKNIQRQYQEENQKLLQANHQLTDQLIDYRKKLENALIASSQFNSVISQNDANRKEILQLQKENKDLQNRLNLVSRNFQLLKEQKCIENNEDRKILSKELESQLENQKKKYEKQIDEISKEHQKQTNQLKEELEKYRNFKNDIEFIYEKAGNYFQDYIDSPQSFLNCIQNRNSEQNPTFSVIEQLKSETFKLLKKIQRQQKMIELLRNSQIEHQIEKDTIITKTKSDRILLKNSIEEINQRNFVLERQIDEFTKQKEDLISDIGKKESEIKLLHVEIESIENEKVSLKKQISNQNKIMKTIVNSNKALNEKLRSLEEMINNYKNQNQDLLNKQNDIDNKIRKQDDQLNLQKILFEEKDATIESIKQQNFLNQQKIQEQIQMLDQIKAQKDELFDKLRNKDQIIQEKEGKIDELQKKNSSLLQELDKQPIIKIPTGSFQTAGFPKELQMILKDMTLTDNCTCDYFMKLNDLFTEIQKWYRNKIDQFTTEINTKNKILNDLQSQIEIIIDLLSKFFPGIKINYKLLLTDDKTRSMFSEYLLHRNDELEKLKANQEQIDILLKNHKLSHFSELANKLNAFAEKTSYYEKKIKKLEKVTAYFKSLTNRPDPVDDISQEQKEKENMMKEIGSLQQSNVKYKKETDELKIQYHNLGLLKSTLEADNANMNKIILKQKRKIEKMERNYTSIDNDKDDEIKRLKEKNKTDKNEFQKRLDSFQSQTKGHIADLNEEIRNLRSKNIESEEKCKLLNSENVELKLKIKKNDTQIQSKLQEFDRERSNMQSQFNLRFASLQNEYKMKIEEKENRINEERRQIVDALSKHFANLVDGIRIDARNIESVCSIIKRKIDEKMRNEIELRKFVENSGQKTILRRRFNDVLYY